jgi:hypothetical protein
MSRTPARFTQADVARTIRAARQAGAAVVGDTPPPDGKASQGTVEWRVSLYRQSNAWRDLSLATCSPGHGKE